MNNVALLQKAIALHKQKKYAEMNSMLGTEVINADFRANDHTWVWGKVMSCAGSDGIVSVCEGYAGNNTDQEYRDRLLKKEVSHAGIHAEDIARILNKILSGTKNALHKRRGVYVAEGSYPTRADVAGLVIYSAFRNVHEMNQRVA